MVPTPEGSYKKEVYNYKTHFSPEEYDYLRNCFEEENMWFSRPKYDNDYFNFPELADPNLDIHKWRQEHRGSNGAEQTLGMSFRESPESQNFAMPPRMASSGSNQTSPAITLTDTETGSC